MTTIRHSTYWPAIAGFAETLRPLWWVVRGWVWFVLASATTLSLVSPHDPWQPYVPTTSGARLFLAALVVASLWAGRTRWGRPGATQMARDREHPRGNRTAPGRRRRRRAARLGGIHGMLFRRPYGPLTGAAPPGGD